MANDLSLSAVVMHVRELQRSTDFYREILQLEVEVTSDEAALLTAPTGDHLVLRALPGASRTFGTVGVQFVLWTARDNEDLDRCERELKARDAFVSVSARAGSPGRRRPRSGRHSPRRRLPAKAWRRHDGNAGSHVHILTCELADSTGRSRVTYWPGRCRSLVTRASEERDSIAALREHAVSIMQPAAPLFAPAALLAARDRPAQRSHPLARMVA